MPDEKQTENPFDLNLLFANAFATLGNELRTQAQRGAYLAGREVLEGLSKAFRDAAATLVEEYEAQANPKPEPVAEPETQV